MLAETLKVLTINDAGYYNSDEDYAEGDTVSYPKGATYTSDKKKRKATDTSNRNLQHKLLMNRTLPIINTTIDPRIPDRVATCGGAHHARMAPTTKPVIMDAACRSMRVFWNPGHV